MSARLSSAFLAIVLASAAVAEELKAPASEAALAENVKATFQKLNTYIKSGAIDFETTFDAANQNLGNSHGSVHFYVEQPDLLRVELQGAGFAYLLVSDGTIFTISDQKSLKYAQLPSRKTPRENLNLFSGLTAIQAQVLRFLSLSGEIASGVQDVQVTAEESDRVGGQECNRYRATYLHGVTPDTWDIWLRKGDLPLPCKTIVRNEVEANQQTNTYTWTQPANPPPGTFTFKPAVGAQEVDPGELGLRPVR